MNGYALEVENFGAWAIDQLFLNFGNARDYGIAQFSQNAWRIVNLDIDEVVFSYDPLAGLVNDAQAELQRFADTDRWREHFARRDVEERRFQLAQARRREQNALRETQRRARAMTSFNFVGAEPVTMERHRAVLRRPPPDWDAVDAAFQTWFDDDRTVVPKVNWLREGF